MGIDRYVALRIRERRAMLGLTQQQIAVLIGVTCQQALKYETGINRISAGRLYQLAQVLEVEVPYFFAGADTGAGPQSSRHQRVMLELARCFLAIADRARIHCLLDPGRVPGQGPSETAQRLLVCTVGYRQEAARQLPQHALVS